MGDSWYRIERNADSAEIILHDEIGAWGITSGAFVAELNQLGAIDLSVHINSPGGSVDDGIAIYNALRTYKGNVTTVNDAMAGSIASVIMQAGSRRVMMPHSRLMVHNAQMGGVGVAVGYAEDFDALASEATKVANNLRETSAEIAKIYAERSGKAASTFQKLMDAETRLTGQAAVDAGLADEVGTGTINVVAFKEAAAFKFDGYREAALIRQELVQELATSYDPKLGRELAQMAGEPATTIAASLAEAVFDAYTDTVQDWLGDQNITIAESGQLTTLLTELLQTLDSGLTRIGLGGREVPDDDDCEMEMRTADEETNSNPGEEPPNPIERRAIAVDAILAGYRL